MRTILAMFAATAGLGLSIADEATAKNLSCISGLAPNEQRLIRDCEPKPTDPVIIAVIQAPPPPPPPPIPIKNGEGGKGGGGHGRDQDHDAPAGGGDPGGPHGAAN